MQIRLPLKGNGCLLDDLAKLAGCEYLSDLRHCPYYRYPLFLVLPQIPAEDYSVSEWNRAIGYILGQPADFPTAAQAYQFLTRALAEYTGNANLPQNTVKTC
ncbi:hypothetical protein [Anaerotruncus rubiinfantis]|uniref:hypothetical protein n=1 Tax=Anaerotruncus rubiinfantis TaxID=1720200 RepID=UPI0012AC599D|nr:hypothetical protein [Anaerotruncus rubiinfantis]